MSVRCRGRAAHQQRSPDEAGRGREHLGALPPAARAPSRRRPRSSRARGSGRPRRAPGVRRGGEQPPPRATCRRATSRPRPRAPSAAAPATSAPPRPVRPELADDPPRSAHVSPRGRTSRARARAPGRGRGWEQPPPGSGTGTGVATGAGATTGGLPRCTMRGGSGSGATALSRGVTGALGPARAARARSSRRPARPSPRRGSPANGTAKASRMPAVHAMRRTVSARRAEPAASKHDVGDVADDLARAARGREAVGQPGRACDRPPGSRGPGSVGAAAAPCRAGCGRPCACRRSPDA